VDAGLGGGVTDNADGLARTFPSAGVGLGALATDREAAQMANAAKMSVDVSPYPTLVRIDAECRRIPAFAAAAPAKQPDAE